jgi:hypothetical protein
VKIWREDIGNRNRLLYFGGKISAIEIDSSNWREEIGKNRLVNLARSKKTLEESSIWREDCGAKWR